ncbi:phage tail spike protein [Leuconostoc pseudomesenteroides]|uniref:phage tail spike protein n=1 Tax=Leuconostoc pseudomesenteroides TaxID=33968 RepID=UPI00112367FF|nr:phage tail spike protein [Leuconostoc pseudomesenteroides]TOZ07218.1 hypothetical protein DIS14_01525 [Leuconostoc pseudomesenteroides]
MIYIFDKKQAIIKVLTNDDFTAAHLNFKINTATTFEFSLPASKALPSGSKYAATPHPLDDSKFIMLRLTERVDNTETIDYSAYELAYQELATDGYIEDKRPQNQGALNLMKIALDGSNWELNNVNVSGTATTNFYYVDRLSAISKVVDLLGGEIVFYIEIQGNTISGRYMDYLARQGADTSKVFASGSNLLTVERQSDTSGIYTAILPRGKGKEIDNGDTDTPDGYGRRINVADVEWKKSAGKPLDKPKGSIVLSDPDATAEWGQINGNARLLLQTYDDIDDVNVLINSAYKTLQSVNHPQIQYSATVADVGVLSLGDTVLIMHGYRDLSYKTRVFEVKYDLLSPDQTELSLGDDLSSNSITSQLNSFNVVAETTSSQTQWTINQIGRPGTTYGATAPDSPKVGDIWFKYLADGGTEIYRWNGDIWELLASPTTADDIATAVDDAVAQAKAHTDEVKQSLSSDIDTAKSQAASAANSALANAKSAATSQFNQAQSALSSAKTDLTNSIASEASARNQAVAAANSQAQTYANQAKSDAMSAASSADGAIRTAISSSANSLSATITQNKSSADSGISTAQATANAAVDGLTLKVSKTDYDQKTGDLSTKINDVKQTADSSAQTIADIQEADGKQDARMSEIENTASGLKSTVSDLSTEQGKQSGYISTLQQRADGFDAAVSNINTTVNSLGQVNQLFNTEFSPDFAGWYDRGLHGKNITASLGTTVNGSNVFMKVDGSPTRLQSAPIPVTPGMKVSYSVNKLTSITMWSYLNASDKDGNIINVPNTSSNEIAGANGLNIGFKKWENITIPDGVLYISLGFLVVSTIPNGNIFSQPMIVFSDHVGTYVQGNYNNNSAIAKAQLTADNAALAISDYKTNADGRISQAQSDIKANATAITQKVSQTDYDKKTGDLTTAVSKAQTTADGVVTTVGNYQTSNDKRVKAAESTIEQHTKDITARVTQADYDQKTGELSGDISTLQQRADGFDATVTKVDNLSIGGRNLYIIATQVAGYINGADGTVVQQNMTNKEMASDYIAVLPNTAYTFQAWGSLLAGQNYWAGIGQYDSNKSFLNRGSGVFGASTVTTDVPNDYEKTTFTTSENTYFLRVSSRTFGNYRVKFEKGSIATDWTPAPEDVQSAIAQVKVTADGISNFVHDSSGNISSNFQTALSKTSIITGSTLATSIQTQTATQIISALTDNNGKIISLINQDSSGVQIAGKNIVLNGDTTVTGAFKVSQANIANGAIGTAQIGDAAITNAKIADLDVSKITGNVTNFIQSYWNGVYGSTTMNANGLSVQSGSMTTLFDSSGAHFAQGTRTAQYSFGNWIDNTGTATSAVGLYMGLRGDNNSFLDIIGPSGAAVAVIAGSDMADGANTNNVRGAINLFADTNIRSKLLFKGNDTVTSTYIEANEISRTMNFYTDNAKDGNGNWFWFNHKVLSVGTFSSTSLLSKKNVIADYEEDALSEISKTDIVEFEYKNDVGEKHISPIIDDVNDEKDYYIPKTILSENGQYVDMYSMISMAWKAIKQLNEKTGDK